MCKYFVLLLKAAEKEVGFKSKNRFCSIFFLRVPTVRSHYLYNEEAYDFYFNSKNVFISMNMAIKVTLFVLNSKGYRLTRLSIMREE